MARKRPADAYARAGVDIEAGHEAVRRMKRHVLATRTPQVITDVGAFGGLFRLPRGYRRPVLVASTDGVGTKLMIAAAAGRYDTVGQDLVNHCVNDILVQGARPLFFLDYLAAGRLDPVMVERVVAGLAKACRLNGCALLGGETAEMPGLYRVGDFDLAGTIVGVLEEGRIIDGSRIRAGDLLIGLSSTGLHTNGYSLARHVFFTKLKFAPHDRIPALKRSAAAALLAVHRSYLGAVTALRAEVPVHGLAHITGGGLVDNLPRVLPAGRRAVIRRRAWRVPDLFRFIQEQGGVNQETMDRTFNLGIGMIAVVPRARGEEALRALRAAGERPRCVGEIVTGGRGVEFV